MGLLTDPVHGLCAQRALGPLHPAVRHDRMERELGAMRRTMIRDIRTRHAFLLNQPADGEAEVIVWPGPDGFTRLTSEDGSITWTQGTEADPHQIDGSAGVGCTDAYNQVQANEGDTIDASGCDDFAILGEDDTTVLRAIVKGIEGSPDKDGVRLEAKRTGNDPPTANDSFYVRGNGGTLLEVPCKTTITANPSDTYTPRSS